MASFRRAISGLTMEAMRKNQRGFDHVIKVGMKPTSMAEQAQGRGIMSTKYQLAVAAGKELGMLDQEYNRLKEKHDDVQYYTYGCDDVQYNRLSTSEDLLWHMRYIIVPQIMEQLLTKRYLLVVENLQWPTEPGSLTVEDVGLPPPWWADSRWLISAASPDVYNKSKSQGDDVISILSDGQVAMLILYAMHQSAEHIHSVMRQESKEYWHRISLECFHYAMTLFVGHSQVVDVTSEELIHQWATQGVIPQPHMTIKGEEEEETNTISSKRSYMHRPGRVILEAFHEYSLLQLPFSPATEAYEASNTGAQFFLYHGLIAKKHHT
ncbi:putative disease resistance protein [Hordeum vulgare]|nr:putative disease resistance protein [Hordeum vulgare]